MGRLEELIKKYGPHSCGIYDLRNVDGDIEWLISEIERLRKEKERLKKLIKKAYGEGWKDNNLAVDGDLIQEYWLKSETQQALKDKE